MDKIHNVGIIGGGVSGSVIALQLAKHGIDHVLFEQEKSLVNGPPFCHLHAGGNLYPDISDEQCKLLLKQSIDMAKTFPHSIDERPTCIAVPISEKYQISKMVDRLDMIVAYYADLIDVDPSNRILGAPKDYYKLYTQKDLVSLSKQAIIKHPKSSDDWMSNAIKIIDYKKLKTPLIIVQEYGWNMFRLGAQAQIALSKTKECNLKTNTRVTNIKDVRHKNQAYNWEIHTGQTVFKVNYLVNSTGYKTGEFDDLLDLNTERLIEFKAAYISKWQPFPGLLPELIFHGERGTPNGMVQLTPYCDDYYQIHGMTKNITLFENGIVRSTEGEAQPEFDQAINQKLQRKWGYPEVKTRTENAINIVSRFVPSFKSAIIGGPPLYGAQQIPGDDPNLRVGEVSFPCKNYARSEIVKASSALTVANQIIHKIQEEELIPAIHDVSGQNILLDSISKIEIDDLASKLAIERGYPEALSRLVIDRKQ